MATGRIPDPNTAPVTAKGDLYTYSTVPAKLAVGSDGETLVADSSQTTGLRYNPPLGSLANPVINGGFDVWQRGTSLTPTIGVATYTADRWQILLPANVASTISRQTTGDTTNLPNIEYCVRVQRNSGQTGTSAVGFAQSMETTNTRPFAGKAVTLSFYARAGANYSATSSALTVYLATGTGTDQNRLTGSYTGDSLTIAGTATLTTTWQRFVVTGTIPTTATEMAVYFSNTPTGTAGAADFYEVTGVQIDVGTWTASTAPTFRRSGGTLAGELAACQRYYWRSSAYGSQVSSVHGFGTAEGTGTVGLMIKMPVTMRVTPTAIDYASVRAFDGANLIGTPSSVALITNNSNADQAYVTFNKTSSFTQFRPYFLLNDATTSGYIGFTAEL
jgi:hypothetical protein